MKKEKYLFFSILIIVSVCIAAHYYMHELAHVVIFSFYGVDSHIEAVGFAKFIVVPHSQVPSEAWLSHSINEAVGYQLFPLFLAIIILLFSIMLYLNFILEELTTLS